MHVFSKLLRPLLVVFLLVCGMFALLQTAFVKEKITAHLTASFKEAGIEATFSPLEGRLPFSWRLHELHLTFSDGETLSLEQLYLRLAFFPLFQGKIGVDYISVNRGNYLFSSEKETSSLSLEEMKLLARERLKQFALPFSIALNHFSIDRLALTNRKTLETFSVGMRGRALLNKKAEEFALDVHLFSPDSHEAYFEGVFQGSARKNWIEASLSCHLDPLPSFLPWQGPLNAALEVAGPFLSWKEIFYGGTALENPLRGTTRGHFQKWGFKTSFALPSLKEITLEQFALSRNLIKIQGKGTLREELESSELLAFFSLPDLALLGVDSLKGKGKGKVLYDKGEVKFSMETEGLEIEKFQANTLLCSLEGSYKQAQGKALVTLSSEDARIPFKSEFGLTLSKESFCVENFECLAGGDTSKGSLQYNTLTGLYEASLFLSIENLDRYQELFKVDALRGSLLADLTLFSEEGKQNARCVFTGTNFHYNDLLVDDLHLNCTLNDFRKEIRGEILLVAQKIYRQGFYLDKLLVNTYSEEERCPFSLEAQGRLEGPFTLFSQGTWNYKAPAFHLELDQLLGTLSTMDFELKHDVSLDINPQEIRLTPLEIQIGNSPLFAECLLDTNSAHAKLDIEHFPLEVVRCLRPRFALQGFVSAHAFFDATQEGIQGALNATLEEGSITQLGAQEGVLAKGSIQMHLNQNTLQIHTDLKASDAQFLDAHATLPTQYSLHPFSLNLDPTRPTSGEVIAEGRLQDLFDFVNLGTNHFTGDLSCRLFLSQTLENPSLQGNITLKNGSYENYFIGLFLKSIEAQFEAQNTEIRLLNLHAQDDQSGEIFATGSFELKREDHFPFTLNAEMHNLHALGFDMIDAHLSGPVYLLGNMQQMDTQGNLLIDKAHIQLTERLPYETPSLPFTYIHKPSRLKEKTPLPGPSFAFHLDLELTANDDVHVEGRGLDALLEGDIHLHGTNSKIAANGEFKLIKGEYIFSGKVFKLTEASLVFSDKPTPSGYLNVSGTLSLPDITITAMMRGPLTSPQLTFQSNPHKSTSSILALILFNKDISEISQSEAIQLASALIGLSGGAGPDVLTSIRKSIGIDRLNISSTPGSDQLAVQIGKYLTRGILVTLSQSATSSQIIVEVELPKGFVFQAETQEQEEGKFSLKWRKSY